MSDSAKEIRTGEIVRAEAIAWLTRLRSPDGADQHQAFEDWYAADPRHADIYDDVLSTWDSTAMAARTPSGEAPGRLGSRQATRPRSRMALAAVAALVLVVLSGIGLQRFGVFGPGRADPAEIASRLGEIRTVTLADGSRVTLDTDSALSVAYTAAERRLTLEHGRVRFDVAHDAARPFVVMAGGGTIIARGTVFDIDLRGRRVTVSLLRGSVEVRSLSGPNKGPATKRLLQPGERLALDRWTPQGPPVPLRADETRWPAGMLSFEDTPLAEVVAAANRYSTAPITLADPALGELRFTGTLSARDMPGTADTLAATFNLVPARGDRGSLILAPRR